MRLRPLWVLQANLRCGRFGASERKNDWSFWVSPPSSLLSVCSLLLLYVLARGVPIELPPDTDGCNLAKIAQKTAKVFADGRIVAQRCTVSVHWLPSE